MPIACSPGYPHFLAIGVISPPEYVHRRSILRVTWMSLLSNGSCAHFVVRTAGAPVRVDRLLVAEQREHGDVLRVDVPWNETRMRGPVLTLASWLRYAATRLPSVRFVAKVDDDSYLHAPGLARLLQNAVEGTAPHARTYIGTLTWYSWYAQQWDRCGFGWTWQGSDAMGKFCRNTTWAAARCAGGCGPAVGPFPFAAGYLIILSAPLANAIAATPALARETARLSAATTLHTHKGFKHTQVFEDVWLGSFVHRFVYPDPPIAYVQLLRSETVVDLDQTQWGSTVRPGAILVHIRSKEPRIFLAVHDFLRNASHCREHGRALQCANGCDAFGIPPMATAGRLCKGTASASGTAVSAYCALRPVHWRDSDRLSCAPQSLKPLVRAAVSVRRAIRVLRTSRAFLALSGDGDVRRRDSRLMFLR